MTPFVPADTADIEEMVDDIDSFEPRLEICSEGFLGGSAGDGPVDSFLGGSRGGGVGLIGVDDAF